MNSIYKVLKFRSNNSKEVDDQVSKFSKCSALLALKKKKVQVNVWYMLECTCTLKYYRYPDIRIPRSTFTKFELILL